MEAEVGVGRDIEVETEIQDCYAAALEDRRRGYEPRMQVASRNWKRQTLRPPLEPSEETYPCKSILEF